jgi:hypothetical protein
MIILRKVCDTRSTCRFCTTNVISCACPGALSLETWGWNACRIAQNVRNAEASNRSRVTDIATTPARDQFDASADGVTMYSSFKRYVYFWIVGIHAQTRLFRAHAGRQKADHCGRPMGVILDCYRRFGRVQPATARVLIVNQGRMKRLCSLAALLAIFGLDAPGLLLDCLVIVVGKHA